MGPVLCSVSGVYRQALDAETELHFPLPRDAGELFALVDGDRERLRTWLPWVDATRTVEDERAFLRSAGEEIGAGRAYHYLIRVRGELAGIVTLSLRGSASGDSGEIGYWLAGPYEGGGVMTRAVALVLGESFVRLGLHRAVIRMAPGNLRSRAAPERLGSRHEGTARDAERVGDGAYRDLELWSLLAPEFKRPY